MIYPIVKFGDPVLEQRGETVQEFDTPELHKLLEDMFESMYASKGVGLAAPQIGISRRIAVIDLSLGEDPAQKLVLINPEIIRSEGKLVTEEGCLSVPGFREPVKRGAVVTARAQNAKGETFEVTGEELAGARPPARDRSSQRQALFESSQRFEARHHPPQDPQTSEGRRMEIEGRLLTSRLEVAGA